MNSFELISNNSKKLILNFLLCCLPLSFILGNLAINLNIILLVVISSFFYFNQIYRINFSLLEKITIVFFIFIFFTGLWNHFEINGLNLSNNNIIILKSIYFLRFLLLILVISFLIKEDLFNFKFFFTSCLFFSAFVGFDIIYQYTFSQDIFGYKSAIGREYTIPRRLSGPFGNEYIAGSYIQRFSIFGICCLPLFYKIKKPYLAIILVSLFVLYCTTIILSGNRMPLILFLISIFLIFLSEKRIRKYFLSSFVLILIIFSFFYLTNSAVKTHFGNLKSISVRIVSVFLVDVGLKNQKLTFNDIPSHYQEFRSFYETWKMNKYIGGGIKSFRINCHNRIISNSYERVSCNTHPHNYYLEIFSDIGLVGFILVLIILKLLIYRVLIKKNYRIDYPQQVFIITMLILITEMIPLRSSGSFFTTGNATYIFLLLAILLGSQRKI